MPKRQSHHAGFAITGSARPGRRLIRPCLRAAALALLVLPLLIAEAYAHRALEAGAVCPLCGTEFTYVKVVSGRPYGYRLDLRAMGAHYDPWPIPQCPKCRYAFTTDDEMPGDSLMSAVKNAAMRAYVASTAFAEIPAEAPPFFYLAREMEHSGKNPFLLSALYLRAAWQAEGTEELDDSTPKVGLVRRPEMEALALRESRRCLVEAEAAFDGTTSPEQRYIVDYMKTELNRRLGDFAAAADCLAVAEKSLALLPEPEGEGDIGFHRFMVEALRQQGDAIAAQDAEAGSYLSFGEENLNEPDPDDHPDPEQ